MTEYWPVVPRADLDDLVVLMWSKNFFPGGPVYGSRHGVIGERFMRSAGRGCTDTVEFFYTGLARAIRARATPAIPGLSAESSPRWRPLWTCTGSWDWVRSRVFALPTAAHLDAHPWARVAVSSRSVRCDPRCAGVWEMSA